MSTGLGFTQAGDFLPYLSYNAKAGKFFLNKDKVQTEVTNPTFVANFPAIKTGWMHFAAGQAPQFVWHPSLSVKAPRPELLGADGKAAYKEGFKVELFSQAALGGVVEFSSSSQIVRDALNALYVAYEAGKASNPGMLPVVETAGSTPIKGKHGTNFSPNFKLVKWVATPAEFSAAKVASNQSVAEAPKASVSEF